MGAGRGVQGQEGKWWVVHNRERCKSRWQYSWGRGDKKDWGFSILHKQNFTWSSQFLVIHYSQCPSIQRHCPVIPLENKSSLSSDAEQAEGRKAGCLPWGSSYSINRRSTIGHLQPPTSPLQSSAPARAPAPQPPQPLKGSGRSPCCPLLQGSITLYTFS